MRSAEERDPGDVRREGLGPGVAGLEGEAPGPQALTADGLAIPRGSPEPGEQDWTPRSRWRACAGRRAGPRVARWRRG